jgi:hypothetical protein
MASRLVTFRVSMHEAIANGLFQPSSTVSLRGDFTQWQPLYVLLDNDGDGIYSIAVPVTGDAGDVIFFKYSIATGAQDVIESLPNREYTLGPDGLNALASPEPHIFDTLLAIPPQNVRTGTRVSAFNFPDIRDFGIFLNDIFSTAINGGYAVRVFDSFVGWDGNEPIINRGVVALTTLPATEEEWLAFTSANLGFGFGGGGHWGTRSTGSTPGVFSSAMLIVTTGLGEFGELHYRAFATNARGTTMGAIETLQRPAVSNLLVGSSAKPVARVETSDALLKKVRISWTAVPEVPDPAASVYIVRWSDRGATTMTASSLPTNFEDDSVEAGVTYEYYIGFESATGERGPATAVVAVGGVAGGQGLPITVSNWSVPSAPTVTAVSGVPGTVLLTWSGNSSAGYYEISLGSGSSAKILGQTTGTHFLATQLPGHSVLTVDEGGVHLGTATFRVTAVNGGGLRASSISTVAVMAPLEADGSGAPAKVRPDLTTSRLLLLAPSSKFGSSSTSRTLGAIEPDRAMWAAKATSPASQFTSAGAAIRSYFVTDEDIIENDWLVDNTVMATIDRTSPYALATSKAPQVVPRYADANFPASFAGHFIDGAKYQSVINARIYNDTNNAGEHVAEAYLMPGARLRLQVLFYSNFKGTILRIGGPTLYYQFFSKIGLYAAQAARANGGWASMTQLVNDDFSQNFIKTEMDVGEEQLAVFRVRIPAFMGGSSTTLVVAAQRS